MRPSIRKAVAPGGTRGYEVYWPSTALPFLNILISARIICFVESEEDAVAAADWLDQADEAQVDV
jgi:hypothetical protein